MDPDSAGLGKFLHLALGRSHVRRTSDQKCWCKVVVGGLGCSEDPVNKDVGLVCKG